MLEALNDYVICSEIVESSGAIEMPNQQREAVKAGKVICTTEKGEAHILVNLPEGTGLKDVTVFYKAASGLMFPDDEKIAVPLEELIAVKVNDADTAE